MTRLRQAQPDTSLYCHPEHVEGLSMTWQTTNTKYYAPGITVKD